MHYILIIGLIAAIVIYQIKIYCDTHEKLNIFRDIFAKDQEDYKFSKDVLIDCVKNANDSDLDRMLEAANLDKGKYYTTRINANGDVTPVFQRKKAKEILMNNIAVESLDISSEHNNPVFEEIKSSINNYLSSNKGTVSDFHLMKDIVDRNCDAKEEEITTQIPIPLYLGLVGTMVGILVGIGYLWISGGLNDLLSAGSSNNGADGVEALLGGVALAMVASIWGILLTTYASMKAKEAKAEVEHNKHQFLSWIQAKLLPNLSNDTAQTLEKMSQNLVAFNNTFSSNTNELGKALSQVNEAVVLQKQLLDAVQKIADKNLAVQNLQLYNALKNSSKEIGTLAEYLENCNDYLINVKALNDKLDASEQRMEMFEEMSKFFKTEISQIEQRKGAISKAVGTVDNKLQEALGKLGDNTSEQIEEYKKLLGKQQAALQTKIPEMEMLVDELKKLSAIKDSISKFEGAMRVQNSKLDNLSNAIQTLARAKAEGTNFSTIDSKQKTPIWQKIAILGLSAIVGLLLLMMFVANWESISKFIAHFKI